MSNLIKKNNYLPELHQNDFTYDHYRAILKKALLNYEFCSYDALDWSKPFVLWRHDVDFSLEKALELAKLESDLGISATYFVDLNSRWYNVLEVSQTKVLRQIKELGHNLGLHFDAQYYNIQTIEDLEKSLLNQKQVFKSFLGENVGCFSFHNPTPSELNCGADTYAGLVNCYSDTLSKNVFYCSDSNGYWRHHRLMDVLESTRPNFLQVNLHPGWWSTRSDDPRSKVASIAMDKYLKLTSEYDQKLISFKRDNMGPIGFLVERGVISVAEQGIIDFLFHFERHDMVLDLLVPRANSMKLVSFSDIENKLKTQHSFKEIFEIIFDFRDEFHMNLIRNDISFVKELLPGLSQHQQVQLCKFVLILMCMSV